MIHKAIGHAAGGAAGHDQTSGLRRDVETQLHLAEMAQSWFRSPHFAIALIWIGDLASGSIVWFSAEKTKKSLGEKSIVHSSCI